MFKSNRFYLITLDAETVTASEIKYQQNMAIVDTINYQTGNVIRKEHYPQNRIRRVVEFNSWIGFQKGCLQLIDSLRAAQSQQSVAKTPPVAEQNIKESPPKTERKKVTKKHASTK